MTNRVEQSIQSNIIYSENFLDIDEIGKKYEIDSEKINDSNNFSQINQNEDINQNQQNVYELSPEGCSPLSKNNEENQGQITTIIHQIDENYPLTSRKGYQIEESVPVNIENITGQTKVVAKFYKYHLKAMIVFLFYESTRKFLKNLIPRYCFAKDSCDCSNNDILVKIWSMITVQQILTQCTWALYCLLPELSEKLKSAFFWHQICSFSICLILAWILNGQSQILVDLRAYGLALNAILYWMIGVIYMRRIGKAKHFSITHVGLFICSYAFLLLVINAAQNIKDLLKFGKYSAVIFNNFIVIITEAYSYICFGLISKMGYSGLDRNYLFQKYIMSFEVYGISFFSFKIGFMMRENLMSWGFCYYLFLSQITSITMQTNLIEKKFYQMKICFKRIIMRNSKQPEYQGRSIHLKVLASRKFLFSFIIYFKLFNTIITRQWNDYYNYNVDSCLLGIPDNIVSILNYQKIWIFCLVNMGVDIACYFYNKSQNFKEILYFIPLNEYISYGISLYGASYIFEALFQKILLVY